jgi:DNA-binding NarL/FixJ family response regulator
VSTALNGVSIPVNGEEEVTATPISVVLGDEHVPMRRSLRMLLDGEPGIQVIGEAGDPPTAALQVQDHLPNVLILDMDLGAGGSARSSGAGLALTSFVRATAPQTQVVLLTMQEHPGFVRRAFDAGAVGLVRKDLAEIELPAAVRVAARGERYVSATFAGM